MSIYDNKPKGIDKRRRGAPSLPVGERKQSIHVTLSPDVLRALDAQGGNRSALIEDAISKYYLIG